MCLEFGVVAVFHCAALLMNGRCVKFIATSIADALADVFYDKEILRLVNAVLLCD